MVPNSIRVLNTKDPVPRHPLLGGRLGVGTFHFIDKKGGGGHADWVAYMADALVMVTGVFSAEPSHLHPAYFDFFKEAAKSFNSRLRHVLDYSTSDSLTDQSSEVLPKFS